MEAIEIIRLLIPVVTFAMGYLLTNIGYKRDKKLRVTREKFEKLYHPFYMLLNELATDKEEGFYIDTDDSSALKQFLDLLAVNMYLASAEVQQLFWKTRKLFISCMAEGGMLDKEKKPLLEKSCGELFVHLMREYVESASALLGDVNIHVLGYEISAKLDAGITE